MADLIYDTSWSAAGTGLPVDPHQTGSYVSAMQYPRWLIWLFIVAVALCGLATIALLGSPFYAGPKLAAALLAALSAGLATLGFVTAKASQIARDRQELVRGGQPRARCAAQGQPHGRRS